MSKEIEPGASPDGHEVETAGGASRAEAAADAQAAVDAHDAADAKDAAPVDRAEDAALDAKHDAILRARMGELDAASAPRPRPRARLAGASAAAEPAGPRAFGARLLAGATGIAAIAGLAWWADGGALPAGGFAAVAGAPSAVIEPVPGTQERVCPGPLAALGQTGATTTPSFVGSSDLAGAGDTGQAQAIALRSLTSTATGDLQGPVLYTAPGETGGRATQLVAAESANAPAGLAGLAAAACQPPAATQWIVADGGVGSTGGVLEIANPTERPATVSLAVLTESGAVAPPGGAEIEILARSTHTAALAGLAPEAGRVAIQVRASSGLVAASVHEAVVEGTGGRGIEIVGATEAPAARIVIPGVPVTSSAGDSDGTAGTTVRLAAPADAVGSPLATVRVRGLDGSIAHDQTATLVPGQVDDIVLAEVPTGIYTVEVVSGEGTEAATPILAAVRASARGQSGGRDLAWYSPAGPLSGEQLVAIPEGPSPRLFIANPGDGDMEVRVTRDGGQPQGATIGAGQTLRVDAEPGAYRVEGLDGASLAVTFSGDGALASFPVGSANPLAEPIRVYR